MDKAIKVFQKLAKDETEFLTEGTKDLLSGVAAAGASTVGVYPADTASVDKQTGGYAEYKQTKLKDLVSGKTKVPASKKHHMSKGNTMKSVVKKVPRSSIAKKLFKKYYSGLGTKLTKTLPAGAITFGAYGATKRLLDEIDEAN